ncbi:capsular polysaccharide transport system permease protein [Roseivivax halotolerans]|uniref:Capsular polysaccharide transport system permease protein n=1 Tax=Roseivivax halotolerans TaxID=93684 RepID=A0A1I5YWY8_9RHOB|nr:hypothetical protein [Roseivivax halotolerans]SFQ48781.1 capsular polysaccharide transport system permease protein [Roseivivax halotolerans]
MSALSDISLTPRHEGRAALFARLRESESEGVPAPRIMSPKTSTPRRFPRMAALGLSAALMIALPVLLASSYLWNRAAPRFLSETGFSVRTEEANSAVELLGGMADLSTASSSDTDILHDFITSPDLVARVDKALDLRRLWAGPGADWSDPDSDPVFAFAGPGDIETLTRYWNRRVRVDRLAGTGLLSLTVEAFSPAEAQAVANAIVAESSDLINRLSALAREDRIGQARAERDRAKAQLVAARVALTRFRNETQIVDPVTALAVRMGVMTSLQEQLADALIEVDLLRQSAPDARFRIEAAQGRVAVIAARISEEQARLGAGANGLGTDPAFADLMGMFETLATDLRFAEENYTLARANLEAALAEADRRDRYLALHIAPTLPEAALRPARWETLALIASGLGLIWSLLAMVVAALRDRR